MFKLKCFSFCSLVLLLGLTLVGLAQSVAPEGQASQLTEADQTALRKLVTEFGLAFGQKDLAALTRLWSAQAPDLPRRRWDWQRFFARYERLEVKAIIVKQIVAEGQQATLQVEMEITTPGARPGRATAGLGQQHRFFQCVKETDTWRIRREYGVADDLARRLMALQEPAAQTALLAAEPAAVNAALISALQAEGEYYRTQLQYETALVAYDWARRVAEQLQDQPNLVNVMIGAAGVYNARAEYQRARDLLNQALSLTTEPRIRRVVLNNLGIIYRLQGNYRLSLEKYHESLTMALELDDPAPLAGLLNNLGNTYSDLGNYTQALKHLEASLNQARTRRDLIRVSEALTNLGNLYTRQGNLDLALDYYRQSLALQQDLNDKEGQLKVHNNLGTVYLLQNNFAAALQQLTTVLELSRQGSRGWPISTALYSLGSLYQTQGDYERALDYYRQSLALSETGQPRQSASTLANIASVKFKQQAYPEALQAAERAATLAEQQGSREAFWQARTVAGWTYRALNQPEQAQQAYEAAVNLIESLREDVAGTEAQQQYFATRLFPYHGLVELFVAQQQPALALVQAERARARVLLDVLQRGQVEINQRVTPAERERERALKADIAFLNAGLARERGAPKPDAARLAELEAQLQKARRDREAFQTTLYAAHPELKIKRGQARELTVADLAQLVPDHLTALLEFVVTEEKLFLFVVTKSARASAGAPNVTAVELPLSREQLTAQATDFRERLARRDYAFKELATQLERALIGPARPQLQGKRRLVLVPDGPLWEVPFQALISPRHRYLLEEYALSYAPSLTVWREMLMARPRPTEAAPTLLAVGNPVLRQVPSAPNKFVTRTAQLAPLPQAEQEVKRLAQLYGMKRSKVFTGAAAREEQIKAEAGRFQVLHLATHGVLNNASPLYSYVLLSQAEAKDQDGLLEAWEIMGLNLQADLVVLSACETARGRVAAGEGVIGLSWAFFVAGSPTTVVSQWQVDSASTSRLMVAFHQQLRPRTRGRAGVSPAAALQQAALSLLRREPYKHPFYWAPFVVIGKGF